MQRNHTRVSDEIVQPAPELVCLLAAFTLDEAQGAPLLRNRQLICHRRSVLAAASRWLAPLGRRGRRARRAARLHQVEGRSWSICQKTQGAPLLRERQLRCRRQSVTAAARGWLAPLEGRGHRARRAGWGLFAPPASGRGTVRLMTCGKVHLSPGRLSDRCGKMVLDDWYSSISVRLYDRSVSSKMYLADGPCRSASQKMVLNNV